MLSLKDTKNKLKQSSLVIIRRHLKLYTIIVLLVGILIGARFEGQDIDGTYYYNIGNSTIYGGVINNDKN